MAPFGRPSAPSAHARLLPFAHRNGAPVAAFPRTIRPALCARTRCAAARFAGSPGGRKRGRADHGRDDRRDARHRAVSVLRSGARAECLSDFAVVPYSLPLFCAIRRWAAFKRSAIRVLRLRPARPRLARLGRFSRTRPFHDGLIVSAHGAVLTIPRRASAYARANVCGTLDGGDDRHEPVCAGTASASYRARATPTAAREMGQDLVEAEDPDGARRRQWSPVRPRHRGGVAERRASAGAAPRRRCAAIRG